ncbi:hypothetical protein DL98DRAFT_662497 [Cadophora sp. DSE1049]|nr:hypothetical protein DL98DRAFT_662497 [Cadophora sp. DSE1049]
MNNTQRSTMDELGQQWINPGDILSLLLLIGADIIQKAIAQLAGRTVKPFGGKGPEVAITPVAFSFGWVAYSFMNLLSAIGEKQLMPTSDCPSIVVNCENGHMRSNQSWILGRLLRDHEASHEVDPTDPSDDNRPSPGAMGRAESIRIDIFELGPSLVPEIDFPWYLGWLVMVAQLVIAIMPWVFYGDWGVMIIVSCGNLLALLTCGSPQWKSEKWAGRKLKSDKITCLTRGNGHLHIMVFIGSEGSWDLETLATSTSASRPETAQISFILAIFWTGLLISVSGLKNHAWYLIGIGGLGMVQNIHAAGSARKPGAMDLHLTPFARMPTIIGKRQKVKEVERVDIDLEATDIELSHLRKWGNSQSDIPMPIWFESNAREDGMPEWLLPLPNDPDGRLKVENVHGALIELEKWVPTAGLAMLQTFFPSGLHYKDRSVKYNIHKTFWKRAYRVSSTRRKADVKRRKLIKRAIQSESGKGDV